MATRSIRSTAKTTLHTILTNAAIANQDGSGSVPVSYGWPAHPMDRDCIFISGPLQGVVEYPTLMAGRKQRNDTFILIVNLQAVVTGVAGKITPHDADVRAEALYAGLEDALANDQSLSNLDGVLAVLLGPTVNGPSGELIETGAFASMSAEVTVQARLL